MPGAHKIGAAISGPGIAGGKLMDTRIFLNHTNTYTFNCFLEFVCWVQSEIVGLHLHYGDYTCALELFSKNTYTYI